MPVLPPELWHKSTCSSHTFQRWSPQLKADKSEARILSRSDRVDETRVGDRVVLYHRDTGSGVVLNPSGSRIWDSLATPASASDLVDRLHKEHQAIPRERIAGDVEGYITSLKEQRLIDEQD